MKVRELIAELRDLPPDLDVFIDIEEFPLVVEVLHDEGEPDEHFGPKQAVLLAVQYPPSE